jgi:hypothetical protein
LSCLPFPKFCRTLVLETGEVVVRDEDPSGGSGGAFRAGSMRTLSLSLSLGLSPSPSLSLTWNLTRCPSVQVWLRVRLRVWLRLCLRLGLR